jgi:hypothetical protein
MPRFRTLDTYADRTESQSGCVQMPMPRYQQTPPPPATIFHSNQVASRLFLLLLAGTLDLRRTPESLLSVLALLA